MVDFASFADSSPERSLVIERLIDAPVSLVFEMWANPEHVAEWLGPRDFTAPSVTMDFRVGGSYRSQIVAPDGKEYWMRGVYREIVENERIVFTFAWEEAGERGIENLATVTFVEQAGKTLMTFRHGPFQSEGEREGHTTGWTECFERLANFLSRVQN